MIDWCGGNKLYTILWCGRNKSDGLHNKGSYHKWQYKVTFFRIKILCIQPWKRMATSASLCEGPILLCLPSTLCKSHGDLHLSFLHFILWQAQYVRKILINIANWMWVFMNYYCWHYPWGKTLGGKTISPYLSLCPIKTPYP